jgi:predicted AlkP superfamily pyrophosphatase or phosphodiesterase
MRAMVRGRRVSRLLVLVLLVGGVGGATHREAPAPKSLVVCFDGLRADAVGPEVTPAIDRLETSRWQPEYRAFFTTHARVIADAPSISGPNHVAILTGVTAGRHGVTSNAPSALAAVTVPDYLRLLERHDPHLVTMKLASWPVDERLPSGADVVAIGPDATIVARAATALAGDVDALFLFLDGPDAAGHAEGFGGAAYVSAVRDADRALGRLLDVVAARTSFAREDWQIVVTTDHGGAGREHGGTSDAETTIPFLVASRHAAGRAEGADVRNVDVTPTVLAHFGIDPTGLFATSTGDSSYRLDGVARVPVTPR